MYQNSQYPPQQQPAPQPAYPPPQQQQPQPPQQNIDYNQLLQKEQELEKFKGQLIEVYNQLKIKDDLFTALKDVGVETADDFNAYRQRLSSDINNQENPPATQQQELYNQEPQNQEEPVQYQGEQKEKKDQNRIDKLERQVMQQQHIIDRNALRQQIQGMLNQDEYPMLSRSLDDGLLNNIMYNRLQYQNQYKKELPLDQALKYSEQNLQAVFKRLGGEIKPQVNLSEVAAPKIGTQQAPPPPDQDSSNPANVQSPQQNQGVSQLPPYSGSNSSGGGATPKLEPSKQTSVGFQRDAELNSFLASKGIQD